MTSCLDETGSLEDSTQPIIPYGFFSEGFLDLNDSSLIIQYDPRVFIDRPSSVGEDLDGSYQSLIGRPADPVKRRVFQPLDYIRVSSIYICFKLLKHIKYKILYSY